jgi:enhancer of polycomb-like protein
VARKEQWRGSWRRNFAQGAVSTSGTTTRTSQRSAKAKGKEPDVAQPILHHVCHRITRSHSLNANDSKGLEQGPPFPPFSKYQDTFTNKLSPDMIAAFTVLPWIPQPQQLLCFAKAIYPYWRERQIERGGHRIIPTLNVSLMLRHISLYLIHSRSSTTSRM